MLRPAIVLVAALSLALTAVACDSGGGETTDTPATDETGDDGVVDDVVDTPVDDLETPADDTDVEDPVDDNLLDDPIDDPVDELPDEPVCTTNGFVVSGQEITAGDEGTWVWSGTDKFKDPHNRVTIEFPVDAKIGDTCEDCFAVSTGCTTGDDGVTTCEKELLPTAGTVALTSVPAVEVEDSVETFVLSGFPYAAEPAQPACVPEGTGTKLGHNVGDFSLVNCLGEAVNLHDSCGEAKAVAIMAVAGWCTACTTIIHDMEAEIGGQLTRDTMQQLYPHTEFHFVLFENNVAGEPTFDTCNQYALSHNIDPSMVLLDWGATIAGTIEGATFEDEAGEEMWCLDTLEFETTIPTSSVPALDDSGIALGPGMATTWRHMNPYASAINPPAVPWYAILDGDNMEYRYTSGKDPAWWFDNKVIEVVYN